MARARNLKPGLLKNEVLGVADPLYTILFEGLWILADRDGKLEDRPLKIRGEVFPYREGLDMNAMLDWLQTNEFIQRYEVKGKRYILVTEFKKHQNPHKNEALSEIPDPIQKSTEEIAIVPDFVGTTPADSLLLTPDSPILTPDPLITAGDSAAEVGGVSGFTPTPAGVICKALRQAGIADTNPGHPDLIVLLEAGATEAEFLGAVPAALDKGHAFAYVLGTVKRQRTEAAKTAKGLHVGPMPRASPSGKPKSEAEREAINAQATAEAKRLLFKTKPMETFDV